MISYFDDFGALLPATLARQGLITFTSWCEMMGIGLKVKKSEVGPKITFLGLQGFSPSHHNGWKLQVSLTPEKASKWTAIIRGHLKSGIISSHELDKLIGKLCFSQTCLFGKFARTQLRCLYRKLHAPRYKANIDSFERITLSWWEKVISQLTPRIPRDPEAAPDFALYTDAATSTMRIAALLFRGLLLPPQVLILALSRAPAFRVRRFCAENPIFGLEMLAPLAFLWMHRHKLQGKSVNLYIDNNNVLTSLVRGDSSSELMAAMIACFWKIAEEFSIDIWLGRVPSKKNPADLPTREVELPFPVCQRVEFHELFKLLTLTNRWTPVTK